MDVDNVTSVKFPPDLCDFEGWIEKKTILVILAHPDDPEFFMGATLARWGMIGHEIHYCLLTAGQKGTQDLSKTPDQLSAIRIFEQQQAANLLGVKSVQFLDYVDGEVVPDLDMRKKIVRVIRSIKPQIVVGSDPLNYFPQGDNRVNHPDHRAAGQAVLDAVFPGAGNPMFFPELISDENLSPVNIEELWFSIPSEANLVLDISDFFERKLEAIVCHRSQIGPDEAEFREMIREHWAVKNIQGKTVFYERFRRIVF